MSKTVELLVIHLWQPWADLIACGAKTIETRTWDIKYRGPVLICATKTLNKAARVSIEIYQSDIWEFGPLLPTSYQPRLGVAVAIADLVDSRDLVEKDRRAAAYADHWGLDWWCEKDLCWKSKKAWCLENIQPIIPFTQPGRQRPYLARLEETLLAPALLYDLPLAVCATSIPAKRQLSLL